MPTQVNIPDAVLEAAIRARLGKPDGPLYDADLATLTSLNADRFFQADKITDLTGLEHCVNLIFLELGGNQITDLTPLAGLTRLWELFLNSNQISNISPLAGLVSLDTLDLAKNQITDISPLAGLAVLDWLYLRNNQISDLMPLDELDLEYCDLLKDPLPKESE